MKTELRMTDEEKELVLSGVQKNGQPSQPAARATLDAELAAMEGQVEKLERLLALKRRGAQLRIALDFCGVAALAHLVLHAVCEEFGASVEEVMSKRRPDRVASARHAAYYLMRTYSGKTFEEVGRVFGRDHSAVMRGCQSVCERCKTDKLFAAKVAASDARVAATLAELTL